MIIRWPRILAISVVLAAGILVVLLWKLRPTANSLAPSFVPWIGLPAKPMDISGYDARQALLYLGALRGRYGNLPWSDTMMETCGGDGQFGGIDAGREIYVARLGDSYFSGAKAWRTQFEVQGDDVVVSIDYDDTTLPPPPPPPPLADAKYSGPSSLATQPEQHRIRRIVFKKSKLQPIADAWRDPALWDASQGEIRCVDGIPAILEACVRGRYDIRDRHCGDALPQVSRLWETVERLLPPADAPAAN